MISDALSRSQNKSTTVRANEPRKPPLWLRIGFQIASWVAPAATAAAAEWLFFRPHARRGSGAMQDAELRPIKVGDVTIETYAWGKGNRVVLIVVIDLGNVNFFHLQYGAAQDCPSGCFNSSAIGLMWSCEEVEWLGITDYDNVAVAREHYVTEAQLAGLQLEARIVERIPYYMESLRRALAGLAAGSPSITCEGTECRVQLDARLVKEGVNGVEILLSKHPLDRGLHQLALASLDDEAKVQGVAETSRGQERTARYGPPARGPGHYEGATPAK